MKVGLASKLDVFRAQLQAAQTEDAMVRSQAALETALEQLRALHHGMTIRVVPMEGRSGVAVDTPQDLERVRAIMAEGARR